MSGYERSEKPERPESEDSQDSELNPEDTLTPDDPPYPADFSAEEKGFARTLREFYSIEEECLPPLYVQTMMDADLHEPLPRGYTHQLTYRVMRRLELPRRSLAARYIGRVPNRLSLRASAPLIAALTMLMAFVLGSLYLTTPSFAEGVRLLFGQTGVQQIASYPTSVKPAHVKPTAKSSPPAPAVPIYWLGSALDGYSFNGMDLDQESWSKGPIVRLQYMLTGASPFARATSSNASNASNTSNSSGQTGAPSASDTSGATPGATTTQNDSTQQATSNGMVGGQGTGQLDIREFQLASPYTDVMQGVYIGAAHETSVDGLPAVYVDGMWVKQPGGRTVWQSGTRSMLMFERDGVIFWITGDQRDGLTEYPLTELAQALIATDQSGVYLNRPANHFISADPSVGLPSPMGYTTDVVALDTSSTSRGANTSVSQFVTFS